MATEPSRRLQRDDVAIVRALLASGWSQHDVVCSGLDGLTCIGPGWGDG